MVAVKKGEKIMKPNQFKKQMDLLEVDSNELAVLLGKDPRSIYHLREGKTKVTRLYELAMEALLLRKLNGNLWKGLQKK